MSVQFDGDGFDAEGVPQNDFSPLPEGSYTVVVTDSEMLSTKKGDGRYIKLSMQIVDGDYKGRLIWGQYNVTNPNAETVKIAKAQLAQVCLAVGVPRPKDTAELHNIPFLIDVKVKERKDSPGEYQNEIKKYRALNGSTATKPAEAAGNDGKPAWMKRG